MSSKEIAFDEATYTEEESICEPENPALMCRGKKVKKVTSFVILLIC